VRLQSEFGELACAIALLAVAIAVFSAFAHAGWPGAPHPCLAEADCYCEAPRAGWIRQPANTWSCLAGVLVGLAVAAHSSARRRSSRGERAANRMQAGLFYPALYACIVVYSGVGAAFFHASLTDWGGKLDMASMVLSFGFWLTYNVMRVFGLTRIRFCAVFCGLVTALLVPRVVFDKLGFEIFAGLAGAVILSEILVATSPLRVQRRWLWASLALYAPALGVWWLSLSGHWLCEPASLLQGHALWHVLTALSPGMLYLYFRDGELAPDAA
jgi:Per1-like family